MKICGLTLCALGPGCGYRAEYGGPAPDQPLTLAAAPASVARADVVQATLAGAREELSSAGALRPGSRYPRVVVEVLRVDESGTGIAVSASDPELPLARGSSVAVVGRAWVEERAGEAPARDTGDIRRVERYAPAADARLESERHSRALRSAARRLGRALGRRLMGHAEPADEAL